MYVALITEMEPLKYLFVDVHGMEGKIFQSNTWFSQDLSCAETIPIWEIYEPDDIITTSIFQMRKLRNREVTCLGLIHCKRQFAEPNLHLLRKRGMIILSLSGSWEDKILWGRNAKHTECSSSFSPSLPHCFFLPSVDQSPWCQV